MNDQEIKKIEVEENIERDNEPTPPQVNFNIATYPSDLTLRVLHDMWTRGDIDIPDFQRNFVWTIKQSSLLIESFLLGLPVPQIFFYIDEQHKNLVIDGLQRVLSIAYFFEGYFGSETHGKKRIFRLSGLPNESNFANLTFNELTQADQRRLQNAVLRAVNVRRLSPDTDLTSIYHIFERLNTGGTPLSPQEIRNCVFHGEMVNSLRNLNEDANWRKILGQQTLGKNQRDVEMLLRVFAMFERGEKYEKPMKEFLNISMKANIDAKTSKYQQFSSRFAYVAKIINEELPDKPFHIKGPLNLAAMDSILSTLLLIEDSFPKDLANRYTKLLKDEDFRECISFNSSDVSVVKLRLEIARKFLIP